VGSSQRGSRTWRTRVRATLLFLGSLLLVLLALEATVRWRLYGPLGLDPRRVPLVMSVTLADFVHVVPERRLLYENIPNLETYSGIQRFRTNSRGLRDREYPLEKPVDTIRVAVIGSSFSLPAGVQIEEAYHSILEERLTAEFSPTTYEFLNFAVGLHGPSQFVAMLQLRALRFDPDLVIVSVTDMSVRGMFQKWNRSPSRLPLEVFPSEPRSFLVNFAKLKMGRFGDETGRDPGPRLPARLAGRADVITKLGTISRESGIPIVIFRVAYDPTPPNAAEARLEARVRKAGLYYFDARSGFTGTDPRSFRAGAFDAHPSPRAHAIFADGLEAYLKAQQLVPVDPGRG
jgi:hypothetical protein